MGWDRIQSDFGAVWRKARQTERDVEMVPQRLVSDVSTFAKGLLDDLRGRSAKPVRFPDHLNVPAPDAHMTLQPGDTTPVIPPAGLQLSNRNPLASFGLRLNADGDARLDLMGCGPGTDWGKKGAESAVMSVYVDGQYHQDVVLWGGSKETPYALSLGNLPAGDHTITLRYAREKSTHGASGVTISSGTAAAVTYPTPEVKWAAEHAPVLYGKNGLDNNHTDTPLGLYYSTSQHPDGTTTFHYAYAFSNEDQGTAADPAVEQARWGRMTDLQHVIDVTVDARGQTVKEVFEGANHVDHRFKGEHEGTHPVIRTATGNNNVADSGQGPLRFVMPPDYPLDGSGPTEDLMRLNPQWFETMGKEIVREGKVDPNGVGDRPDEGNLELAKIWLSQHGIGGGPRMADPRHYLYVEFDTANGEQDPVNVRVQLQDGRWFDSDLGHRDVAINRDGWAQTSVRLPPGTRPEDVAQVKFVSLGKDLPEIEQVGHLYMLDSNYRPQEVYPTVS